MGEENTVVQSGGGRRVRPGEQDYRDEFRKPILAVTNWHADPACLMQQIESYNIAFNNDIYHIVNINTDYAERFWMDAEVQGVSPRTAFHNVSFVEPGVKTAWGSVMQALLAGVRQALRQHIDFDYVLWHTSADLMLKRDANLHIRNYQIGHADFDWGVGGSESFELKYTTVGKGEGEESIALDPSDPSLELFVDAVAADRRLPAFYRSLGLQELYKSRCEGSFFRRDVFFEIVFPMLLEVSIRDMEALDPIYPMEEFLLAQCVEFFCARNPGILRTSHIVMTPEREDQYVTEEDIAIAMEDSRIFGIKRFIEDPYAPIRAYARQTLEDCPHLT
jgi:hypothetical protein